MDELAGCFGGILLIFAVIVGIAWGILALFSQGILVGTEDRENIFGDPVLECTYLIRFSKVERYYSDKEVCPTLVDLGENS